VNDSSGVEKGPGRRVWLGPFFVRTTMERRTLPTAAAKARTIASPRYDVLGCASPTLERHPCALAALLSCTTGDQSKRGLTNTLQTGPSVGSPLRRTSRRLSLERMSGDDELEENLEAMREREGARLILTALEGG
jgi:hypothetical protein